MAIDWTKVTVETTPEALTGSSAARFGGAEIPEPKFAPSMETTVLPTAGALAGGIMAASPQLRTAGMGLGLLARGAGALSSRVPQIFAPYVPSLFGSTVGTVAGTAAERAIEGDLLSAEGGKQLLGNVAENAVWDLGGNLAFRVGGKIYRLGKDALGFGKTEIPDAAAAAQKFLSERGATLTRGQLTEGPTENIIESAVREGAGSPFFKAQEQGVRKAVEQGKKELLDSLDTSDAFKLALIQGDDASYAAGSIFKNALDEGEKQLKAKVQPFYQSLDEKSQGIMVDFTGAKKQAQDRLKSMTLKGGVYDPKEIQALEDIVAQDDYLKFSDAHELRSRYLSKARDLKNAAEPSTVAEKEYNSQVDAISKSMDNAFNSILDLSGYSKRVVKDPNRQAAMALKAEYDANRTLYREGIDAIYNETMSKLLKESSNPERIGEILYRTGNVTELKDLYKTAAKLQNLGVKDVAGNPITSKNMIDNLRYGYINTLMRNPDEIATFGQKIKDNAAFERTYKQLFDPEQRQFIDTMTNAAQRGLTDVGERTTALRTRQIGAAANIGTNVGRALAGGVGIGAIYSLPPEAQQRLSENLPETVAAGLTALGALVVTPRMMAKAMTNKQTMDALIGIAKAQNAPAYGGAVTAKIIDRLNKIGVFDSEYISEVDKFFNRPPEQNAAEEVQQQNYGPINWENVQVAQ